MHTKSRLRILKLSQITNPDNSVPLPTKTAPNFIASNQFPAISKNYNPYNVEILNKLFKILNDSIFYLSNGNLDLFKYKNNNFTLEESSIVIVSLKNILLLSKYIYQLFVLNAQTVLQDKVSVIIRSQIFLNIPSGNISNFLSQKLGGNFKDIIIETLGQLR